MARTNRRNKGKIHKMLDFFTTVFAAEEIQSADFHTCINEHVCVVFTDVVNILPLDVKKCVSFWLHAL
jgi:hypothetical protein